MGFSGIVSQKSFWKSVVGLGLTFAVVFNLISLLMEYGGFSFGEFYADKLADGKWVRFVLGQLAAAFLYGFILAYGQFRAKQKEASR